jgi:hypothetical protein
MLNRRVGLSHIVSCGNQSGATFEEYFNYLVEDDNTRVIAAFVEGFKQPEKLLAVAHKAAARGKPLIILKGGRSEVSKRAAATHSGSLAGSAEVVDAAFRQGGIVSVRSLNELIDAVSVFSCETFVKRYNGGRRIGVLSGSGGECTLVSDAAANVGIEVPELTETTKAQLQEAVADFGNMNNPLDGTGAMYDDDKIFPRLLQALIDDRRRQHRRGDHQSRSQRSAAERAKKRQPFFCGHRKSRGIEPKTHRMLQLYRRRSGRSGDSAALAPSRCAAHGRRRVRDHHHPKFGRISRVQKKQEVRAGKSRCHAHSPREAPLRDFARASRLSPLRAIRHTGRSDGADSERR